MPTPTKKKLPSRPAHTPRDPRAVASDAIASLKKLADPKIRAEMGPRYGIHSDNALGVRVSNLNTLAKALRVKAKSDDDRRYNHDLAQALWDHEFYDARMLACFVDEPSLVTARQMDAWARDFDNWAICDHACFHLFDKVDPPTRALALGRVDRWAVRNSTKDEFVKRGAFALLASIALHDKKLPDAPLLERLDLIRGAADDDRNFVKKGVSWALRSMGRRPGIRAKCLALAKELAASEVASARWIGKDAVRDLSR